MSRREWLSTLVVAVLVGLGAFLLSAPVVLVQTNLGPDIINYLSVANAFAHGRGFVDPIQWHFYLDGAPPQPAWALLSPVISLALAPAIWLGGDIIDVTLWHTALSAAVGALMIVVARTFMGLPAATAAAVGLAWSGRWAQVSQFVLTEPYAVLGVLVVIATAAGVRRSPWGAACCAAATIFGWAARANVPLIALAIVVAAIAGRPLREAIRDRLLWLYIGLTVGGIWVISASYEAATGLAPYANYDAFFEMFVAADLMRIDKEYVGAAAFLGTHSDELLARYLDTLERVVALLFFKHEEHYVGYLLPLVATVGVFARSSSPTDDLRRRVSALAGLGFCVATILTYGGFEPRYLLLSNCCVWLAAMASLDLLIKRREWPGVARLLPLVVVVAVFAAATATDDGARAWQKWQRYTERSSRVVYSDAIDSDFRVMCRFIDPDYVVAAKHAEALHFWCGAPVFRLPLDIDSVRKLKELVRDRRVRYLVVDRSPAELPILSGSRILRRLKTTAQFRLYEVVEARRPAPVWDAAPALACLADHPKCPKGAPRSNASAP